MNSLLPSTFIRRTDAQISTTIEGETILLQLESGNYFALNEVGAVIWEQLSEPRTIEDLCRTVANSYEVAETVLFGDVCELLLSLNREKMVELQHPQA